MTSARTFTVETAAPIALVISEMDEITQPLVNEYLARGVEVHQSTVSEFFQAKRAAGEYDYLVVVAGASFIRAVNDQGLKTFWQNFVMAMGGSAGKYLILPFGCTVPIGVTDGVRVAYYAEYIAENGGYAPLLDRLLMECLHNKQITIPGDGLVPQRILSTQEVAEGLRKWIFSTTQPTPFYCVSPEADSLLNMAYHLRATLPYKIEIKFSEESLPTFVPLDDDALNAVNTQIGWMPVGEYKSKLNGYIDKFFELNTIKSKQTKKIQEPPIVVPNREEIKLAPQPVFVPLSSSRPRLTPLITQVKKHNKKVPKGWGIAIASAIVAIVLYGITLVTSGAIIMRGVRTIAGGGEGKGSELTIPKGAKTAATYMQANVTTALMIPGVAGNESLKSINKLLSAYLVALDTARVAQEVSVTGKSIAEYIFSEGEGNIVADLNEARMGVGELYDKLSLLDGALDEEPPQVVPAQYREMYGAAKAKIQEARRAALTGKSLLAAAPNILGVGDRRKYAVMFQNNMELRPTGGFIGSFAIISLENAKLFDIQVYDVYAADGQLKGHVEPPEEIKKYLGEANWYLRDSNWDPDFPTSARRVEWFLGKTLAQDVQGVIGINLYTLQDILRALGTVHVPEYSEDITGDNVFERAEYHAEMNFFPGSTQKKEFIGSLADAVIEQMRALSSSKVMDVTKAVAKSIDEKNTTLAIDDAVSNRALSALGWNGEIRTAPCPEMGATCTGDYAMIVESNFGINKANYFIKRSIEMNIVIQPDYSISHELNIEYTNTAKTSAWPAGRYKNYVRLYMPEGSVVSSIMVGQTILSSQEYKVAVEHGRTVVGFLVDVPLDSTRRVTVSYSTPSNLTPDNAVYSMYWQKQSGTAADPLNIHITYPLTAIPEIVSPKADYKPGSLDFALSNVTDRRVMVKFK